MTPAEVKQLVERLTEIADDSRSVAPRSLVLQAASALSLLAQENERLKAEIEGLKDPVLVHHNMLCGTIAKPELRSLLHAYGAEALAQYNAVEELRARTVLHGEGDE